VRVLATGLSVAAGFAVTTARAQPAREGKPLPGARPAAAAPAPAPALAPVKPPPGQEEPGFHFGSYGRVRAATDLRGGGPKNANFVAHGSRLDLDPYAELELRNTQYPEPDVRVRVVSTLALAGDPFHYTGRFEMRAALRNLFVDVRGVGLEGLTIWAGARMYRGDDIYLLDFWPLDNLNTVGGGASLDASDQTRVQLHVGQNRLLDGAFQYQQRPLPVRSGVGSVETVTLDRPRTVASAKLTQFFPGMRARQGFKVSLHGEGHLIGSGVWENSTTIVTPPTYLPADNGFVIGAQGTAWGFGDRDGFAHLFVRYARGMATYGELGVPFGFDEDRRASGANEFLLAGAGNVHFDRFALLAGWYARRFTDASSAKYSANRYWEGIVALRPHLFTGKHTGVAFEWSYQFKNMNVLDDSGRHRVPQAWRLSLLPFVTPFGPGVFQRPILYALYTATMRNGAAQDLYPLEDPRASRSTEHYLGIGAEWWFNSSSYP
jgi:maltoporin